MRAVIVISLAFCVRTANAAPPTLSAAGKLEPRGACATYMDFTRLGGGSVPDGLADSIATSTYDASGRLTGERWWRADAPVRVVSHHYNAHGRLARTRWRLTNGKLVLTIVYAHDRRGNVASKTTVYPNGSRYKNSYRYNRHGVTLARESGESGTMSTRRFRYRKGRIHRDTFDRDGNGTIDERTRYHYDKQGRLSRKLMTPTSSKYARQRTDIRYNAAGQVVEIRTTHIWPKRPGWTGVRRLLRYQYDKAGNLVVAERRVTPATAVNVRWLYDYSCHGGKLRRRRMRPSPCRRGYSACGKP